jgi:hypothetical protein
MYVQTREFNILDYGVVSGAGADQVAIQAAIDAASAYTTTTGMGGTVIIPAGDWDIAAPIVIKSYVRIKAEPGAVITIPGSYAQSVYTSNDVALQDFWIEGGHYIGTTNTWNFLNLIASDNAKRIVTGHIKNVKITDCNIAFNVNISGTGWCNANTFEDIIIWNPVTFLKTRDAVASGVGFDGNFFSNITVQRDASLVMAIDSLCGDGNQFINCFFWDLAAPSVGVSTTIQAYNNVFKGYFCPQASESTMILDLGVNNYIENWGKVISHHPLKPPIKDITYMSAGNGLVAEYQWETVYFHDDDAIDITANPQFADGFDGQKITIIGSSDSDTLTLDDGTGLQLAGGVQFVLGLGDSIVFVYIAALDLWVEISRSNN